MLNSPWDIPPPNADDPAPRFVQDHRVVEREDFANPYDWLNRPRLTFRDDVRELIADIRHDPHLAFICAGMGFIAGLGATVGLAALLSVFQ